MKEITKLAQDLRVKLTSIIAYIEKFKAYPKNLVMGDKERKNVFSVLFAKLTHLSCQIENIVDL